MQTVERSRIKRLAVKRVINDRVLPCRKCGTKAFVWNFPAMVKTCKNVKCQDESGAM